MSTLLHVDLWGALMEIRRAGLPQLPGLGVSNHFVAEWPSESLWWWPRDNSRNKVRHCWSYDRPSPIGVYDLEYGWVWYILKLGWFMSLYNILWYAWCGRCFHVFSQVFHSSAVQPETFSRCWENILMFHPWKDDPKWARIFRQFLRWLISCDEHLSNLPVTCWTSTGCHRISQAAGATPMSSVSLG